MNIELPYERQAMQSNIIPSDLCGADVLMFMALHGLYAAARDKKISREQGVAYKKCCSEPSKKLKRPGKALCIMAS